jgi:hypothetical protein
MRSVALNRRIYLDPELVSTRAEEFPIIRDLLGKRVQEVLCGKSRRADAAPLLLRLLEQTGEGSQAMLQLFSEGIACFDERDLPGWREWRSSLPGLDRVGLLSRYFELLAAMWFEAAGHDVQELEPAGAPGRKADLLVSYGSERVLVEATSPGPHSTDWIEDAMDRLVVGLSRVESGLEIEVDGYQSLTMDPPEGWKRDARIGVRQQEQVINAFAREAEKLDLDQLPQVVIASSAEQPVTITAVAHHPEMSDGTAVVASWSRSGIAPNTKRLAEKILAERRHLPDDQSSLILVDLSRWQDFRNADYYLRDAAKRIAGRLAPAVFVGTCVGTDVEGRHGLIERGVLARDETWAAQTALGQHFTERWAGIDHWR